MVVLDTNILIDYIRVKGAKKTPLENVTEIVGKKSLAISVLVVQELFRGKSVAEPEVESTLMTIINSLDILPYTFEVARKAGEISRDSNLSFPDAAIAATAIVNGAQLATINIKDFAGIRELELYKI